MNAFKMRSDIYTCHLGGMVSVSKGSFVLFNKAARMCMHAFSAACWATSRICQATRRTKGVRHSCAFPGLSWCTVADLGPAPHELAVPV